MLNESNLHGYQEKAVTHILSNTHCALFLEMGLGKTVSTLTAIKKLMFEELEIDKTLVIAPKRVAESVWDAECWKWEHLKDLRVAKVVGPQKKRIAALAEPADVYLIGRDNVAWLVGLYGGNMLPFDMLVIDELSSFKNPNSQRFKTLRRTQPCFKRVVGLTGTPAPNGLIDLWSQIYLLDRGERLGKFVTKFRDRYFTKGRGNGVITYNYNLAENGEQQIHDRIGDICLSMKAEDYLKLPGTVRNNILLDLPDKVMKQYKDFEKNQVLELIEEAEERMRENEDDNFDKYITAANAAALTGKLLQFANGAVYDETKAWSEVHKVKIEETKNIIEEAAGKPVLIAWTFRHDMYRLKEALKSYQPRELKTDDDIQDWNAGKIKVLMMHPASGGHGLNLQKGGNIIIWFGQTWSLELEQQFNARLDRQGQEEVVFIHKLIAKGTEDENVIAAQLRKSEKQDGLMEAVKAEKPSSPLEAVKAKIKEYRR